MSMPGDWYKTVRFVAIKYSREPDESHRSLSVITFSNGNEIKNREHRRTQLEPIRPGSAFFWIGGRPDVPKLKPAN